MIELKDGNLIIGDIFIAKNEGQDYWETNIDVTIPKLMTLIQLVTAFGVMDSLDSVLTQFSIANPRYTKSTQMLQYNFRNETDILQARIEEKYNELLEPLSTTLAELAKQKLLVSVNQDTLKLIII